MFHPSRTSSISLLPTDSRSEEEPPSIVGCQGDHSRKSAARWRARRKITTRRVLSHRLDPQDTQVCSSCLSELGAVCARLVSKLPTTQTSDAVRWSFRSFARSSTSTRPGGRRNSNVGAFGEWLGSRVWQQHLVEMLQNTSHTRTSREMSISTKMSFPDCSPVAGASVEMVEGSLALQTGDQQLVSA